MISTQILSKPKSEISDQDSDDEEFFSNKPKRPTNIKSSTPVLDNFGRDLTKMASDESIRPNCW